MSGFVGLGFVLLERIVWLVPEALQRAAGRQPVRPVVAAVALRGRRRRLVIIGDAALRDVPASVDTLVNRVARMRAAGFDREVVIGVGLEPDAPRIGDEAAARD